MSVSVCRWCYLLKNNLLSDAESDRLFFLSLCSLLTPIRCDWILSLFSNFKKKRRGREGFVGCTKFIAHAIEIEWKKIPRKIRRRCAAFLEKCCSIHTKNSSFFNWCWSASPMPNNGQSNTTVHGPAHRGSHAHKSSISHNTMFVVIALQRRTGPFIKIFAVGSDEVIRRDTKEGLPPCIATIVQLYCKRCIRPLSLHAIKLFATSSRLGLESCTTSLSFHSTLDVSTSTARCRHFLYHTNNYFFPFHSFGVETWKLNFFSFYK